MRSSAAEIARQAMLSPAETEVWLLEVEDGLTLDEIAARLGISDVCLRQRRSRAVRRVRSWIERHAAELALEAAERAIVEGALDPGAKTC